MGSTRQRLHDIISNSRLSLPPRSQIFSTSPCSQGSILLSVDVHPNKPGSGEARRIKSEDMNVEHILDVFTSIDTNARNVWDLEACGHFVEHFHWNNPRQTVMKPKIEDLPDGHRSKVKCLLRLSKLLGSVGNYARQKRFLTHPLTFEMEGGSDSRVLLTLRFLSRVNRGLSLHKEWIPYGKLKKLWKFGNGSGTRWNRYIVYTNWHIFHPATSTSTLQRTPCAICTIDLPPGARPKFPALPIPSGPRLDTSLQGRQREGLRPFRDGFPNRFPFRLAT